MPAPPHPRRWPRTVTVLARGEILSDGSYDKVSQDPRVREAYMGTEHE